MYVSVKMLAVQEGCSVDTVFRNYRAMEQSGLYPMAVKQSGGIKIDPEAYNDFLCQRRRLKINRIEKERSSREE